MKNLLLLLKTNQTLVQKLTECGNLRNFNTLLNLEIWRFRDLEIWRFGDLEIWRFFGGAV